MRALAPSVKQELNRLEQINWQCAPIRNKNRDTPRLRFSIAAFRGVA